MEIYLHIVTFLSIPHVKVADIYAHVLIVYLFYRKKTKMNNENAIVPVPNNAVVPAPLPPAGAVMDRVQQLERLGK